MANTENFQIKVLPETKKFLQDYHKQTPNFDGVQFGELIQSLLLAHQKPNKNGTADETEGYKTEIGYHLKRTSEMMNNYIDTANNKWQEAISFKKETEDAKKDLTHMFQGEIDKCKANLFEKEDKINELTGNLQILKKIEASMQGEKSQLVERITELKENKNSQLIQIENMEVQINSFQGQLMQDQADKKILEANILQKNDEIKSMIVEAEKKEIKVSLTLEKSINEALINANKTFELKFQKHSDKYKAELDDISSRNESKIIERLKHQQQQHENHTKEMQQQIESYRLTIQELIKKIGIIEKKESEEEFNKLCKL